MKLRIGLAAILLVGCQERTQLETALLTEARPGESNFSGYAPAHPYRQSGQNLLSRVIVEVPGPEGVAIEVRDLYVPPGASTDQVALPGAAILQVLSGEGSLDNAGQTQSLTEGTSYSLSQGANFKLDSKGIAPLVVRARIFVL